MSSLVCKVHAQVLLVYYLFLELFLCFFVLLPGRLPREIPSIAGGTPEKMVRAVTHRGCHLPGLQCTDAVSVCDSPHHPATIHVVPARSGVLSRTTLRLDGGKDPVGELIAF